MPQGWFHSNDALIPGNKHKPKVHRGVYQSYASGSKGGDTRWFSYSYDDDENVNEQSTTRRKTVQRKNVGFRRNAK